MGTSNRFQSNKHWNLLVDSFVDSTLKYFNVPKRFIVTFSEGFIMIKYRIIEETDGNGNTKYFPEYKVMLFFWSRFEQGFNSTVWHSTMEIAERELEEYIKELPTNKTKKVVLEYSVEDNFIRKNKL